MDKNRWIHLNNGPSASQIKKKTLVTAGKGVSNLVEAIISLREDEHIEIPHNQMIFPVCEGPHGMYQMTPMAFKKYANTFNIAYQTKDEMLLEKKGPQEKMIGSLMKAMGDNIITDINYNEFVRRGIHWTRRSSMMHTVMTQTDLLTGWRLAANMVNHNMPIWFSNPGGIFYIRIPTRNDEPDTTYTLRLTQVPTDLNTAYADWTLLSPSMDRIDHDEQVPDSDLPHDIYGKGAEKYVIDELRFNFQAVAATIFRFYLSDERRKKGMHAYVSAMPHPVPEAVLSPTLSPKPGLIRFEHNLLHNVLIEYESLSREGTRKLQTKKLNIPEREALKCGYLKICGAAESYAIDERLLSCRKVFEEYLNLQKQ